MEHASQSGETPVSSRKSPTILSPADLKLKTLSSTSCVVPLIIPPTFLVTHLPGLCSLMPASPFLCSEDTSAKSSERGGETHEKTSRESPKHYDPCRQLTVVNGGIENTSRELFTMRQLEGINAWHILGRVLAKLQAC